MTDNNKKNDIFSFNLDKESGEALKQKKREWKDWQEKQKKEEDPIERYCYDIRGERAAYEITYEEMKENMAYQRHVVVWRKTTAVYQQSFSMRICNVLCMYVFSLHRMDNSSGKQNPILS